jgi:hypothetical protein
MRNKEESRFSTDISQYFLQCSKKIIMRIVLYLVVQCTVQSALLDTDGVFCLPVVLHRVAARFRAGLTRQTRDTKILAVHTHTNIIRETACSR